MVITSSGWKEVRSPVKPYEKVKDEIMGMLYQQKMEHTYRSWLQSLRSDSHIENKDESKTQKLGVRNQELKELLLVVLSVS